MKVPRAWNWASRLLPAAPTRAIDALAAELPAPVVQLISRHVNREIRRVKKARRGER